MIDWAPLLLSAACLTAPPPERDFGVLWQPTFAVDTVRRGPATPYVPQPGDIVFFNNRSRLWKSLYVLAFSGPPTHMGIVVEMPDGALRLLEAGPKTTELRVVLVALPDRLHDYPGESYVRQRTTPLTAQQSGELTDFACAVDHQHVRLYRFAAQLTPFRRRGPVRTEFLGKPKGVKHNYYCSELVVEACVAVGLMDAETSRPAASYPRDMFFDRSHNPYLNEHLHLCPDWAPPAYWTPCE